MNKVYLIKSEDLTRYFQCFKWEYDIKTKTFSFVPNFTSAFKFAKISRNLTMIKGMLTRINKLGFKAVIVEAEVAFERVIL